jgi:hypothetical protein
MARIDFDSTEESKGNGSSRLPNGPYVLKVQDIEYEKVNKWGEESKSVHVVFDVAEGEHKDALKDRPDFAHTMDLYFDKNLGLLKHQLMCMTRSNANFDALAAFNCVIDPDDPNHDRALKAFVGKLFGGNVVTYHRPKKDGSDGTTERVWVVYDADEVRSGKDKDGNPIVPLEDQYKSGYTPAASSAAPATPSASAATETDDDVPF